MKSYGKFSQEPTHKSGFYNRFDIFSEHFTKLNTYCQRHFFYKDLPNKEVNQLMETVYEISGNMCELGQMIMVSLECPSSYPHRNLIECAAKLVNQRHIFDYYGRKLWLDLKDTP